jgi:hypothetical protein
LGCGRAVCAEPARPPAIHSIGIVLEQEASPAERRVAEVLKARILSLTPVTTEVGTARKPGAEGFAVKTVQEAKERVVSAAGADDRGVLYAAGKILRRLHFDEDHVELPPVDVSTSPGFRFRGFSANQGGTMMTATKARPWTEDELHGVVLDYALAGGNCFYTEDKPSRRYDFVKSFLLLTTTGARPDQLPGGQPCPTRLTIA